MAHKRIACSASVGLDLGHLSLQLAPSPGVSDGGHRMQRVFDQRGRRSNTIYWKTRSGSSSGQGRIGTAETLCNARALPSRLLVVHEVCRHRSTNRHTSCILRCPTFSGPVCAHLTHTELPGYGWLTAGSRGCSHGHIFRFQPSRER